MHDNEALAAASNDSLSILPVYLSTREITINPLLGLIRPAPIARGSDLVVRIGRPESVLVELAKAVGADVVYMQREVSHEEARMEERVEEAIEREGIEVKWFWGSTLYHVDYLGFEL